MPPAARITDLHTCPATTPNPHTGGPIIGPGCPTVFIGSLPAARVTDMCTCAGPVALIVTGEPSVMIGSLMAARVGDFTAHGGVITVGFPTVEIGGPPQGAALMGAAGAGAAFAEKCDEEK